jgi:hypothetical protein
LDEQCAQALSWGMPYELFWHGPLSAYFIYAEKARVEFERKQDEMNNRAYLNGLYTREALLSVYHMFNPYAGKNARILPYPSKPIKPKKPLTPEQERKKEEVAEMIREHNLLIKAQMEGRT